MIKRIFREIKKSHFVDIKYRNLTNGIAAIHAGWKINNGQKTCTINKNC